MKQSIPKEFIKNMSMVRGGIRTLNAIRVQRNQQAILKEAESNNLIFIKPTGLPLASGNIEHYYHFIFDLLLPLSRLLKKAPPNVIFALNHFGIFTDLALELFPGRLRILNEDALPWSGIKMPFYGMGPTGVRIKQQELEIFRQDIFSRIGLSSSGDQNEILLIERMPPDPYFIEKAQAKGAGASRRSILNHDDLNSSLQSIVRGSFVFHNLQLENISFREQVKYFSKAKIVIAQHGAGLANSIWMNPNSIVIELSNDFSFRHFSIISKLKGHMHSFYGLSDLHAEIDVDDFVNYIFSDDRVSCFFGDR